MIRRSVKRQLAGPQISGASNSRGVCCDTEDRAIASSQFRIFTSTRKGQLLRLEECLGVVNISASFTYGCKTQLLRNYFL